jgi:rod shape determining protein RodA
MARLDRDGVGSRFDFLLLGLVVTLSVIGLLLIYSATHDTPTETAVYRQIVWVVGGLVVLGLTLWPDYRTVLLLHRWLYVGNLLALGFVLVIGEKGGGAQRWFAFGPLRVQPSEFAKLILVLTLARFLASPVREEGREEAPSGWRLLASFLHMAVPMGLVFLQPDLGTALAFLFI